jgi:hypothetical protein
MPSTIGSSNPSMIVDGFASGMPRVFVAYTTSVSSAIIATGFWAGVGEGSRGGYQAGMRIGDVLLHRASTDSATPGRVTTHSVIASTADQASTSGSTGYSAAYNVTIASAT